MRQMRDLELEIIEWKEKHKYADQRNTDYQNRIEGVEVDYRKMAHEREKENVYHTVTQEQRREANEKKERAFGDIKTLIGSYKYDRNSEKEGKLKV